MEKSDRIYVTGHRGMVGSKLIDRLRDEGYETLVLRTSQETDLRDQSAVDRVFNEERPDVLFMVAARVGGIQANRTQPGDFLYDNLAIQGNLFDAARRYETRKVLFLGSSCIYPRECPQPMKEEYLMTGPVEPTNEGYAIAKIAGLKMARYFRQQYGLNTVCPMPCNLYGPNDNFDPEHSHVMSALVRKFVEAVESGASSVEMWGTGSARREFLHVDDVVDAMLFLMDRYDESDHINVGVGEDISIRELAVLIAGKVGYEGELAWDTTKPDGMPRKVLDVSKMTELGWTAKVPLEKGINGVIEAYWARRK